MCHAFTWAAFVRCDNILILFFCVHLFFLFNSFCQRDGYWWIKYGCAFEWHTPNSHSSKVKCKFSFCIDTLSLCSHSREIESNDFFISNNKFIHFKNIKSWNSPILNAMKKIRHFRPWDKKKVNRLFYLVPSKHARYISDSEFLISLWN